MWIILGFRDTLYCHTPVPFFVGMFLDYSIAIETRKKLNKESMDDAFYKVIPIEENTLYDYQWNVNIGLNETD